MFNTDFYVTAATVIPVLYLALAVQGSTLNTAVTWLYAAKASHRRAEEWVSDINERYGRRGEIAVSITDPPVIGLATMVVIALIISLAASLTGEIAAILLLYTRRACSWEGQLVLISTITAGVMVGFVTAGTALAAREKFIREKLMEE